MLIEGERGKVVVEEEEEEEDKREMIDFPTRKLLRMGDYPCTNCNEQFHCEMDLLVHYRIIHVTATNKKEKKKKKKNGRDIIRMEDVVVTMMMEEVEEDGESTTNHPEEDDKEEDEECNLSSQQPQQILRTSNRLRERSAVSIPSPPPQENVEEREKLINIKQRRQFERLLLRSIKELEKRKGRWKRKLVPEPPIEEEDDEIDEGEEEDDDLDNEEYLACVFCGLSCEDQVSLQEHLQGHTKENPHFCKFCEESFPQKRGLEEHMAKFHPTQCRCNLCDDDFTSEKEFRKHMSIHKKNLARKPFECKTCGNQAKTLKSFARHLGKPGHHAGTCKSRKNYSCSLCAKIFSTCEELSKHIKWRHGENSRFKCQKCEKAFSSRFYLSRHEIVDHKTLKASHHHPQVAIATSSRGRILRPSSLASGFCFKNMRDGL